MATTKDITMKQFNGTDYDTLYPKTKVEQVENLTPSSIGAVSKTGDTMTGTLTIKAVIAETKLKSTNDETRCARTVMYDNGTSVHLENHKNATNYRGIAVSPETNDTTHALSLVQMLNGTWSSYDILHTGNAQSLGFPKIATGSYVGTGYSGQSHPMSINVGFTPKLFWVGLKDISAANGVQAGIMLESGDNQENGLFIYPGTKFVCSPGSTTKYYVTVTWGSTMSWYGYVDFDDTEHGEYQFNEAGVTYYWVAIG